MIIYAEIAYIIILTLVEIRIINLYKTALLGILYFKTTSLYVIKASPYILKEFSIN